MSTKDRVALIDGDEIAYSIALRWQEKIYRVRKDGVVLCRCQSKQEAVESVGNEIGLTIDSEIVGKLDHLSYTRKVAQFIKDIKERTSTIMRRTNSQNHFIFLSPPTLLRTEIATLLPYKGTRILLEKPKYLLGVREVMRYEGAIIYDKLEADDAMSIMATTIRLKGKEDPIICSSDKDLRTVSGLNYNIGKKVLSDITPVEALYNFYFQILIGDATDNIPSPYMLGEVKAKKLLDSVINLTLDYTPESLLQLEEEVYAHVLPDYNRYLSATNSNGDLRTKWFNPEIHTLEGVIIEVANLLWMKRNSDLNDTWLPPTQRSYLYSY